MKKLIALIYFGLILAANLLPISMSRVLAASPNLISNPSVETADSSNSNLPQGWLQGNWGTNTTSFSYPTTGQDGSKSVKVQISSYTSGDAKWYFAPVAISPGAQYTFSDYYESSISSDIVAQFDNGSGSYTYTDLGTQVASSSAWALASVNLTAPSTAKNVTIFHLINSVGWLSTDNFSLTSYTAPSTPTVSLTAPTQGSTVSGSVQLSATASDSSGIAGVQFKVDGVNIGNEDTTSPYQASWDTTMVSNGTHALTAVARNAKNVSTASTAVQVTVNNSQQVPVGSNLIANPSLETPDSTNPALPVNWLQGGWGTNTTTFSYVTNGGHTGIHSAKVQTTAYTSGDAKWYFSPVAITAGTQYNFSDYYESNIASDLVAQFDNGSGTMTYQDLGSQTASTTWKQATASFTAPSTAKYVTVFHLISGVGSLQIDDVSLAASTAPSVNITAPATNATVSGSVQLVASASATTGVKNVQFKIDGVNQGTTLATSPYQTTWDTTKNTNGDHLITAVVTTSDNRTATSTGVVVDVSNQIVGSNLIPNPSLEVANPTNSKAPANWVSNSWGTNTTTFSYLSSGHNSTHSAKVQITKYTDGDAKWYFDPVAVTPDTQYKFSDYYESTVSTEVDAAFNMSDGSTVYQIIGLLSASTSWSQFNTTFSVPLGAQSVTIFHLIDAVGSLTTDDFSMKAYTPTGFNRGLVTLTFDDGYDNEYTQALPLLQKYGFTSTQFIITDEVGQTGYLTTSQIKSLYSAGNEIASHTVTHDDMTQETTAQLTTELSQSQSQIKQWVGVAPTDIAYPYGLYNTSVVNATKKYYQAARGVEDSLNSKDNFNAYDIKVQNVYDTTTTAQVSDWVTQARATNTWLVLVYHSIDPDLNNPVDSGIYNITPTQLDAQLAAIKSSGVTVETMAKALAEITPQLSH